MHERLDCIWMMLTVFAASAALASAPRVTRTDSHIPGADGVTLAIREVRLERGGACPQVPVLLVHGARAPGVASFDLPVPGFSLAEDLARAGHCVYVLDLRGYGGSTRPPAMERQPPGTGPSLVRSDEAVRDLQSASDWIRTRTGAAQIALLGWATGGHWAGMFASLHPERVSHLVLLNTLYAGGAQHPSLGHGSDLEDPTHPGRFHLASYGGYRLATGPSLVAAWDKSIPEAEKAGWRTPAVVDAYVREALASDPTSGSRHPASMRFPTGALEDSFYLATGHQLWDASFITAATLIVRSERDFWSRPEDVTRLEADLVHAARVKRVALPNATHFAHLDNPEHGRALFVREVLAWLAR